MCVRGVSICNLSVACVPACPTGVDRPTAPKTSVYTMEMQFGRRELPQLASEAEWQQAGISYRHRAAGAAPPHLPGETSVQSGDLGATVPPWSASHPYVNLYGPHAAEKSAVATVAANQRLEAASRPEHEVHHIVLDFGTVHFPVLEGQSIAIVLPGVDASGCPHRPRHYSVANPRDGERPGDNNVSLFIRRVVGPPGALRVEGSVSNLMCDLRAGAQVHVIGPFGSTFLMPNDLKSRLVMICTGTGSAPMRAMIERRRRLRALGQFDSGKMMLFFGARTQAELAYFGELQSLPEEFIDIHLACSRAPEQPRKYVQDLLRERSSEVAKLLEDPNAYFYVCGLKAMEEGVVLVLREIADQAGLDWRRVAASLRREGRLHLATY